MNRIIICLITLLLMLSISIYIYNKPNKYLTKEGNEDTNKDRKLQISIKEFSEQANKNILYKIFEYFKNGDINNNVKINRRNKRSIASIANCIWRVLNYPYMYNFYPILNFGVSKIMNGLGYLISNVHFPLFSSTTNQQQPLTDSELQAQELANAQGQALSVETSTTTLTQDHNNKTQSEEYNYSNNEEDKDKLKLKKVEKEKEKLKQKEEEGQEKEEEKEEKIREVNEKINEKAEILAKKYVQMYFSQNTQQILDTNSQQLNLENNEQFDIAKSDEPNLGDSIKNDGKNEDFDNINSQPYNNKENSKQLSNEMGRKQYQQENMSKSDKFQPKSEEVSILHNNDKTLTDSIDHVNTKTTQW